MNGIYQSLNGIAEKQKFTVVKEGYFIAKPLN